jgi:hypothetical protein
MTDNLGREGTHERLALVRGEAQLGLAVPVAHHLEP